MSPVLPVVNTVLILAAESPGLFLLTISVFVPLLTEHVVEVHEVCSTKDSTLSKDYFALKH